MFTSASLMPGRSARSVKWSSCSTRSIAGTQRRAASLRSKSWLKSRSKSVVNGSGFIRRAMEATSLYVWKLTAGEGRYLSVALSSLTLLDCRAMALPPAEEGAGALVTGASSGIGEAMARRLAERGYRVGLVARSEDKLRELADELGGGAEVLACDLADAGARDRLAEAIERRGLTVEVLVN